MAESPLGRLLGSGPDVECRTLGTDMFVHWYPRGAIPGDSCLCGATAMRDRHAAEHEGYDWDEDDD